MPRAQVNQAVIYIFAGIVVLIILGFGYKSLSGARESLDQVQLARLQDDLSRDINAMSSEFGTFREFSYDAPEGVTTVCFAGDPAELADSFPPGCTGACGQAANAAIGAYIGLEPDKNVFLLSTTLLKSMKIDRLSTGCCDHKCYDTSDGRLDIVIEGMGDRAKIKDD